METQEEKVFVAVGKDVEEGLGTLRWALRNWTSKSVSFVILHVSNSSKDFVHTPFGKLPATVVSDEKLEDFRAREQERVDNLLCKYMAFCCKVKAEVLKIDKSEEPVHKILVELVSCLGIKKLVMGIKNMKTLSWKAKSDISGSCYVHKHKPEFCELFIASGGQLVFLKEEKDEGGYFEDENGVIVADFRKKSKEKGSFKGWLGRKLTDNASNNMVDERSSPHRVVSPSDAGVMHEGISDRWEDNAEEIKNYIQCLLDSNSQVLEEGDETMCLLDSNSQVLEEGDETIDQFKLETTDTNMSSLTDTVAMKAKIEEAEKMVEEKKNEAKADAERRRKAERVLSLCNQRAEEIDAQSREEMAKQGHLNVELDTVRDQLQEISSDITESNSRLRSVLDVQGELMVKLQAYSLEKSWMKAEMEKAESEKAEMLRQMEEIRRHRDVVRRSNEYCKAREAMAATSGLNYGYREFSAEELSDATDEFSEELMVAAEEEGAVYRGRINHTSVAIQFKTAFCMMSLDEFKAQVEFLSQIRHPHLLTMIGACMDRRCIIWEYMQQGSLHNSLFPSSIKTQPLILPWHARIRIAANLCSALAFLHSSQPKPTAHGRLASSRVLLDRNLTAKIGGLRALSSALPGHDIVALGLLILQLLTGRKTIGREEVKQALEGGVVVGILDKTAGDWPLDLAAEFAGIGLRYAAEENRDEEGVKLTEEMIREVEELRVKAENQMVDGGDKCGEEGRVNVPDVFLCPIFQEVMKEPHVAADGFSYELEAIKEWLDTGHETSPMTNLKLKHKRLTPNHTLRSLITDWRASQVLILG